jgi:hypothetical protein
MASRLQVRLVFVALLVGCAAVLAYGVATTPTTASADAVPEVEPRENATVVTESAKFGTIIAWHPNGSLMYYEDEHTKYFDVDPVEGTAATVEYAATDTIHTAGPNCQSPPCARNLIERTNLSTGETEVIYSRYDAKETAAEWHDHVRIDEDHILVADMIHDQVFKVDTETEIVEWAWDAQSEFPVSGGGPYPGDWAHLNDVELLDDGRVMVSLRNQDQVVFLDQETGLIEEWTLGADGDHGTLYEQHNPDYIPEERGGPAVLVADSENGRIVEYQRVDGEWTRTWEWADERVQWPRDADRLPNGNTLITDTNGKRLIEVAPNGSIVWSVRLSHPYDAERLNTGPESSGGESARSLGYENRTGGEAAGDGDGPIRELLSDVLVTLSELVTGLLPHRWVNAAIYVAPVWMGRPQFFAVGVALAVGVAWPVTELRWWLPPLEWRSPVVRREGQAADDEDVQSGADDDGDGDDDADAEAENAADDAGADAEDDDR